MSFECRFHKWLLYIDKFRIDSVFYAWFTLRGRNFVFLLRAFRHCHKSVLHFKNLFYQAVEGRLSSVFTENLLSLSKKTDSVNKWEKMQLRKFFKIYKSSSHLMHASAASRRSKNSSFFEKPQSAIKHVKIIIELVTK